MMQGRSFLSLLVTTSVLFSSHAPCAMPGMSISVQTRPLERTPEDIAQEVRMVLDNHIRQMRSNRLIGTTLTPIKGAVGGAVAGASVIALWSLGKIIWDMVNGKDLDFAPNADEKKLYKKIMILAPDMCCLLACAYLLTIVPTKAMCGTHPNFDTTSFLADLPDEVKKSSDMMLLMQSLQPPADAYAALDATQHAANQNSVAGTEADAQARAAVNSIFAMIRIGMLMYQQGKKDGMVFDRFKALCRQYGMHKELDSDVPSYTVSALWAAAVGVAGGAGVMYAHNRWLKQYLQ